MELSAETVALEIDDASGIGAARRRASTIVSEAGLNEEFAGQAALAATELATNIHLHARRGRILLRPLENAGERGIEIRAIDSGPGMDVGRCLVDGSSTRGTSGVGLGAVRRMSTLFDVYSSEQKGTVVLARLWAKGAEPDGTPVVGAVCVPLRGEHLSGDAWTLCQSDSRSTLAVADGLGHGPLAAAASRTAMVAVQEHCSKSSVVQTLQATHAALRGTRGGAMHLAFIEHDGSREVRTASVGNVSAVIVDDQGQRSCVTQHGTLGLEVRKLQEQSHTLGSDALIVLHSDGITSHWRLDDFPGLRARHPSLIAGLLYRDFSRDRDDATVLVVRFP
jgi:anti-sigma regulatory factor (Ser/Thr protein kinase)